MYNDAWRDEELPIAAAKVARRTELVRIVFKNDGECNLVG